MLTDQPVKLLFKALGNHNQEPTLLEALTKQVESKLPLMAKSQGEIKIYRLLGELCACLITPNKSLDTSGVIQLFNIIQRVCTRFPTLQPVMIADSVAAKARGVLAREGVQYISAKDGQLYVPELGLILNKPQDTPVTQKIYDPHMFNGTAIAWMSYLLLEKEIPQKLNLTQWKAKLGRFSIGALHAAVEQMAYFDVLKKIPDGRATILEFAHREAIWRTLVEKSPNIISKREEIQFDPLDDKLFREVIKVSGDSALSRLTELSETNRSTRMMRSVNYFNFKSKMNRERPQKEKPTLIEVCEIPFDFPINKKDEKFINIILLALSQRNESDPRVQIEITGLLQGIGLKSGILWNEK